MALTWQPVDPWRWVVVAGGVLVALALLVGLARRGRALGSSWSRRLAVVAASLVAVGLLAAAVANPVIVPTATGASVHLVVVLDVSDSVLRHEAGWPGIRERVAEFVGASLARLPAETLDRGQAAVVTFRDESTVRAMPLAELPDAIRRLEPGEFAAGDTSDLGAGLDRARQTLTAGGGRGAILLVSDGNDLAGGAMTTASEIARLGIPITILPMAGGEPAVALSALDLAEEVTAGEATTLRGVIWNRGAGPVAATLRVSVNAAVPVAAVGRFGPTQETPPAALAIEAGAYSPLRPPITFSGGGLQYVDVLLETDDATRLHHRRLFTFVDRPLRLLAVGNEFDWMAALATDVAEVTVLAPADLATLSDLTQFDAVVLSSAAAPSFAPDQLERLAQAVTRDGLGLMVLNGDHGGAPPESDSVLKTYVGTPIDPLLPVSPFPRPITPEPPPRHVVMLIDSSDSMDGWPLAKAKEIAAYIVMELLRPVDTLDVISFTTEPRFFVEDRLMDDAGKAYAVSQISTISSGGGTDPTSALQMLAGRQLDNCGLFFLSDGGFGAITVHPQCRATVFGIGAPFGTPLDQLADPIAVDRSFNPDGMVVPYFKPEERKRLFEEGDFPPLTMAGATARADTPFVPEGLLLPGSAVSFPREGASVMAVRPKLTDPVLVYGAAEQGQVGVMTSRFTTEWTTTEDGRRAVEEWLTYVVPFSARDRYAFQVTDDGRGLHLTIALRGEAGVVPQVDRLDATVEMGRQTYLAPLEPIAGSPATFTGVVDLPRGEAAQAATLTLTERGAMALPRSQRVPLLVPPAATPAAAGGDEANSYGLNVPLLTEIADLTGGRFDPGTAASFFTRAAPAGGQPLWPWLLAVAAVAYLSAVALRRLDPER